MAQIRSLFDVSRALNRPIEKVITYQNRGDEQLRTEISEYVVTDGINENFHYLLTTMQQVLQGGGGHDIGVWVSGFYGSGKSSFTKYLGFALDRGMKVGSDRFLQLLKNRMSDPRVPALFNQVSTTYDPVVIFLDLASEMLAGASMEDISTVLYLKVLQWAGYSEDLKVAELERMLEKDGKLVDFEKRAAVELDGTPWQEVHNQPLVANPIAARLASAFYPRLFEKPEDFQNVTLHVNKSEITRATEMIELVRRKSRKENIIFIVDEVGQYVSAKTELITNLQGLAQNLKHVGEGRVWLFGTAQQTLTEDNPTAMINAPSLYKLKDRFPIQIHLEASDIKEICHKRLLTKSATGDQALGRLFQDYGASLRTATQLSNAGVYESPLDRITFINLYPFLPAHFEILLQLLGRLARKTGGLGLRSAIKVLQDVLVERGGRSQGETILADAEIGALANTVTFYDSLRRDIQSSYGYIVDGVQRVLDRHPAKKLYHEVAKSVAVLQILENLPVTAKNIAALLHPTVTASSLGEDVDKAVEELLKDGFIPLGEKNGSLRFLTQAAVTLQKEFDQIEYRNADIKSELSKSIRTLFKPLPSARLNNVRPVTAGIRIAIGGGQSVSVEGDKEPIQIHIEFVVASAYDQTRKERENDSRASRERTSIFLLGRTDPEAEKLAVILVRCQKFVDSHRNAGDPETQEFVRIISERSERTASDLEKVLKKALVTGSFIAHGAHRPVSELDADLAEASKIFLADAAAKVFDRYPEAPAQVEGSVAEKFLKTPIDRITTAEDPLQLVSRAGGHARIRTDHKALLSIKDYLSQTGWVEGRRLLEHFNEPPFGWSKDTTRYLLAALFVGMDVKFRIAGQDHLVRNDETLGALSSNKALGSIGIASREERPDPDALVRASERLRDLSGENVLPLEDEIATAAKKHFPGFQHDYSALAVELRSLQLAGADRAEDLSDDLTEVVRGDGSDAVARLGGIDSTLYDSLKWARKVKLAFAQGLRETIADLQQLRSEIEQLPDSGIPGQLKSACADHINQVTDILGKDAFYNESATLQMIRHDLMKQVKTAVTDIANQQAHLGETELTKWQKRPDWADLLSEDRSWFVAEMEKLAADVPENIAGLRRLLAHEYDLNHRLRDLEIEVDVMAAKRRKEREEPPKPGGGTPTEPPVDIEITVPAVIERADQLEMLVAQIQALRGRLAARQPVRIHWKEQTKS
jgi:Family of unknown function (DUF6079)